MITYSETRSYVKRVLAKKEIYMLLWNLETNKNLTKMVRKEEVQDE